MKDLHGRLFFYIRIYPQETSLQIGNTIRFVKTVEESIVNIEFSYKKN